MNKTAAILCLIVLLGLALRIAGLDARSIWLDEQTSLELASASAEASVGGSGFDRHTPPAYYLVLSPWMKLAPSSLGLLRGFSTLWDLFALILVFYCARELFDDDTALLSTTLYALMPFTIYYAQEGRMYSMLVTLVLATFYLARQFITKGPSALRVTLLLIIAITGMYTHYYYALSLFAISLYVLLQLPQLKQAVLSWWASMLVVGIAFVPWLTVIVELAGSGGQNFRKFVFLVIPYAFFRFAAGYAVMPLNAGSKESIAQTAINHLPEVALFTAICGLLCLFAAIALWKKNRDSFFALMLPLLLPPFIALAISLKAPLLSERYLIVCFPFFVLLLAYGIIRAKGHYQRAALSSLSALVIYSLVFHFYNPAFENTNWRALAHYLLKNQAHARSVYVRPEYCANTLKHYVLGSLELQPSLDRLPPPEKLWLVERGGTTLPSAPPELARYKKTPVTMFPHGNGLRVYLLEQSSEPASREVPLDSPRASSRETPSPQQRASDAAP